MEEPTLPDPQIGHTPPPRADALGYCSWLTKQVPVSLLAHISRFSFALDAELKLPHSFYRGDFIALFVISWSLRSSPSFFGRIFCLFLSSWPELASTYWVALTGMAGTLSLESLALLYLIHLVICLLLKSKTQAQKDRGAGGLWKDREERATPIYVVESTRRI